MLYTSSSYSQFNCWGCFEQPSTWKEAIEGDRSTQTMWCPNCIMLVWKHGCRNFVASKLGRKIENVQTQFLCHPKTNWVMDNINLILAVVSRQNHKQRLKRPFARATETTYGTPSDPWFFASFWRVPGAEHQWVSNGGWDLHTLRFLGIVRSCC